MVELSKQDLALLDAYEFLVLSNKKAEAEYAEALARNEKQFFRAVKRAGIDPKQINPIWRNKAQGD